jgi:hypothetical protein
MARDDEAYLSRVEQSAQLQALEARIEALASQFPGKPAAEMTYEDYVTEADVTIEIGVLSREREILWRAFGGDDGAGW